MKPVSWKTILIIVGLVFAFPLFAEDVSENIVIDEDNAPVVGKEMPSQAGLLFQLSSFNRQIKISPTAHEQLVSPYIAPGIFGDYNLKGLMTVSVEAMMGIDLSKRVESSTSWQFAAFAKKWVNSSWGFVGLGLEYHITTINRGWGDPLHENDLFIALILMGENVHVKGNFYSSGYLRAGVSVTNNMSDRSLRYYFMYSMGIGYRYLKN